MRLNNLIRLLTLLAFALFGGAMPVAASGDHVVICGADGIKRIVAFDFESGTPVETEIAAPDCQDCFGIAPMLLAQPDFAPLAATDRTPKPIASVSRSGRRPVGLPPARAPPSLII